MKLDVHVCMRIEIPYFCTFCLCTGKNFNRLFFNAVQQGCIPVLTNDAPKLPFEAVLDYSTFTMKVSDKVRESFSVVFPRVDA